MSLFKAVEWWSTNCGNDEQFDHGCLCIANIDNSSDQLVKVITGGFAGVLRIFGPHAAVEEDGSLGSPRVDSLLLEVQLNAPILGLEAGRFVSSSENIHLAILHPRKLSVYGIIEIAGSVEHGAHYRLGLMYEHNLQRSAFSIVAGTFGKVKGRDFLCVMSLDGTVSFFEQESFAFSRFLPGALLPGPLAYLERTDVFVTVSSSCQLEAYKYQVLAVASSSDKSESHLASGKKVSMDWCYNLGEPALDVCMVTPKNCPPLIYVLGERHVFCLKDNGTVKFVKKLEFQPSCFHVYAHGIDATVFYMIASHTGLLMIYQDVALRWALNLSMVPIHISRINLRGLTGGIVALSEDGRLTCSYLGTNPTFYTPPSVESREINFAETDKELSELYKIIKASYKSGAPITKHNEASLSVSVTVSKELNLISSSPSDQIETQPNAPSITLKIELQTSTPIENVQLICNFDKSYVISQPVVTIPNLSDVTHLAVNISLRAGFVPSTLSGIIFAVYNNVLGAPSIVQTMITLPMKLCMSPCPPQKDADFKITIGSNKEVVKLDDLFPDFNTKNTGSSQAMGFQYYDGPVVTILVAKSSQRYRLQSDNFGAMAILASELLLRLQKWFASSKDEALVCSFSNSLPLQEFFFVVNKHLQSRQKAAAYEKRLSQLAAQFRAIQKRLLFKFKDKTTVPLSNLDLLLEATYRQITTTSDAMEAHQLAMESSLSNVNAAAHFLAILIKLCTNISNSDYELLRKSLCPPVEDECEQGWEELVSTNLDHLLKTTFSKPGQEYVLQARQLHMPEDIGQLKKRLSAVIEFISKGTLTEEESDEAVEKADSVKSPVKKAGNGTTFEEAVAIPLGSRFGERQTSARRERSAQIQQQGEDLQHGAENIYAENNEPKSEDVALEKEKSNSLEDISTIDNNIPEIHTVVYDASNTMEEF